jgi:hypothetical protein
MDSEKDLARQRAEEQAWRRTRLQQMAQELGRHYTAQTPLPPEEVADRINRWEQLEVSSHVEAKAQIRETDYRVRNRLSGNTEVVRHLLNRLHYRLVNPDSTWYRRTDSIPDALYAEAGKMYKQIEGELLRLVEDYNRGKIEVGAFQEASEKYGGQITKLIDAYSAQVNPYVAAEERTALAHPEVFTRVLGDCFRDARGEERTSEQQADIHARACVAQMYPEEYHAFLDEALANPKEEVLASTAREMGKLTSGVLRPDKKSRA